MEMIEKKTYETPEAEKMLFNYRDQVVAASSRCTVNGSYTNYVNVCSKEDASENYNQ